MQRRVPEGAINLNQLTPRVCGVHVLGLDSQKQSHRPLTCGTVLMDCRAARLVGARAGLADFQRRGSSAVLSLPPVGTSRRN